MQPVSFYANRPRAIAILFVALILLPLGSFLLTFDQTHYVIIPLIHLDYVGWAGLVSTLFMPLFIPWHLLRAGPHLIIGDEGIDERGGLGLIPWSDILKVSTMKMGRGNARYLCFSLRKSDEYLQRLPLIRRFNARANTLFGIPATSINFSLLEPTLDAALPIISHQLRAHHSPPTPTDTIRSP